MTTFPTTWPTFDASHDQAISPGHLAYFRARFRNRLHEAVLGCFIRAAEDEGLTKAVIARRLGKRPEQISRWLGAPGNWTLDSVSDLLLAMNSEAHVVIGSLRDRPAANEAHEWAMRYAAILAGMDNTVSLHSLRSNSAFIPQQSLADTTRRESGLVQHS